MTGVFVVGADTVISAMSLVPVVSVPTSIGTRPGIVLVHRMGIVGTGAVL